MNNESVNNLLEIMENGFLGSDILESDVPELDLYMDQITTLLEKGLGQNRREEDDKIITKTMINNYSKEGLLHRIKGKKYSKQHVLMILLIYNLKQSLSISDINRLFEGIKEQISDTKDNYSPSEVSSLYQSCIDAKNLERELLPKMMGEVLLKLNIKDNGQEAVSAAIALAALSSLCRRGAEEIIDKYF